MEAAPIPEYRSPQDQLNEALNKPQERQATDLREQVAADIYSTMFASQIEGVKVFSQDIFQKNAIMAVDAADILIRRLATTRGSNI